MVLTAEQEKYRKDGIVSKKAGKASQDLVDIYVE